jgi:hypothetical protein
MLLHTHGGRCGAHAADTHAAHAVPTVTATTAAGCTVDTDEGQDVLHQGVPPTTHGALQDEVGMGAAINQPASKRGVVRVQVAWCGLSSTTIEGCQLARKPVGRGLGRGIHEVEVTVRPTAGCCQCQY